MARKDYIFTSESVSEGHPDKICDRISDRLVDVYLKLDPEARTAIETVCTKNYVGVIGETRCAQDVSKQTIEASYCLRHYFILFFFKGI